MYESGIVDCTGDNKRGTLHTVRLPGWTLGRLACALFLRGSGLLCLDCSFSWCCPAGPKFKRPVVAVQYWGCPAGICWHARDA